ncbi:hypothetical protein, partial [Thiolapillus sp.]
HWQTSVNGCAGTTPSGAARTVISKLGLAGAFEQKLTVFFTNCKSPQNHRQSLVICKEIS